MLSFSKLVKLAMLALSTRNLVVDASDLPESKSWRLMTRLALEGKKKILFSLFGAEEAVGSGPIY